MANAHQRQLRADIASRPSAQAELGRREIAASRSDAALRQTTRPLDKLPADVLSIPPDEMRRLGYWVVDQVIEHFEHGDDGPAVLVGDPEDLADALGGPLPHTPGDPMEAMQTLVGVALKHQQHGDHPRYFARVPGPSSYAGVLGEWLGTGHQTIAASWAGGSGPATVELVVCQWLASVLGLPDTTEGVLLSGGSMANITGLVAVRNVFGAGVVYLSDQTHSSIARGLRSIGLADEELRILATDDSMRLPVDALRQAINDDRRSGKHPLMVVATAGTTNTGTVDELPQIAELCRQEGLWLHVDAAYGGPAALCEPGRHVLSGIEHADSVVLDPHKWLFQPYDVGCLLVRRSGVLEQAYAMNPEYLLDVKARRGEVDLRNRSLELTRRSRALKLWMTFRTYGAERLGQAVERGIALAERAEQLLREDPTWEVITPAQLGVVTWAAVGATSQHHRAAAAALTNDGYASVTTTSIRGRTVLRLCTLNPRTTEDDLRGTLHRLAEYIRHGNTGPDRPNPPDMEESP
jgi:aromatic-L-amino-acid/L-tryptophan decarboxylase